MALNEGAIIGGSYRIDKLIAKGGMGLVYRATHVRLRKKVALKIMLTQFLEFKEQITRFLNEALGVADVHHRNIVDIMDVGTTDEGLPFFVMEFLQGETLRARLKRCEKLPYLDISRVMIQTLSGLSVLHARGIVHRDMKPSNIFISTEEDGTEVVKLLDFGVSKFHLLEGDNMVELTTTGTILGTPSYMSPEQARGKRGEVDTRSDLYSCGVILYRAVTGLNPFRGDNYNETIVNILTAECPPPSFFVPELPDDVDRVIMKAIHREKDKRYQECKSFIEDLKRFVAGDVLGIGTDVLPIILEGGGEVQTAGEPSQEAFVSSLKVSRFQFSKKLLIPAIAAIVVVLGLFLWGIISLIGAGGKGKSEKAGIGFAKKNSSSVLNVAVPSVTLDAVTDAGAVDAVSASDAVEAVAKKIEKPTEKPEEKKHKPTKKTGKKKTKKGKYIFMEFPE